MSRARDAPVKREREEPETLVVVGPTKHPVELCPQVRRCLLGGEAEDRDTVEGRGDVGRDGLEEGKEGEGVPKEPQALLVVAGVVVEGLVEGDHRELGPVDEVGGVDADGTQNAAEAIAKEGSGESSEDGGRGVLLDIEKPVRGPSKFQKRGARRDRREKDLQRLGSEDLNDSGRVGSACGDDGADGVLLERQRSGVHDVEEGTESLEAREAFGSRTSRERARPDLAENVGDQDDEDGAHIDRYGLEVTKGWNSVVLQQGGKGEDKLQGTY